MSDVFGSLHPFFEGGEINGRKMANAGFMSALLEADPFTRYDFFVGNPEDLRCRLEARGHLAAVRRNAVRCLHRTELPAALRTTPYHVFHFSDPVSEYPALCQARNRYAPALFPITAVNHSINYKDYAAAFLAHLWPGCSPRDAIGANSSAAVRVLEGWFGHLRTAYALDPATHPGPRLTSIPMGVEPSVLPVPDPARRAAMRRRLGLDENSVMVLLFGRLTIDDKMDFQPLFPTLRRARALRPAADLRLVLAGYVREGDATPELVRAMGRLLDVPLDVLACPTPEEKLELYAAADIFTSPSDNIQETFGLSLLEAGAAALPSVVSDWNGYRDIVLHGETGLRIPTLAPEVTNDLDGLAGLLYDNQHQHLRSQRTAVDVPLLAQAFHDLACNKDVRRRMGQSARARVLERFTCQAVLQRWLDFWAELRATPISSLQEARVRAARHPFSLPFGQVFASYATQHPTLEFCVHCTELGRAIRSGRIPLELCGKAVDGIAADILRPLLVLARRPISLGALGQRLEISSEVLESYLLWALKHDLLEPVRD